MKVDIELLRSIGLRKAEIDVYLVLLKSGQLIASDIAKQVQMQRPNAYDALKRLIEKGLANYVIKNNRKYFQATSPDKIKDYMDGLKKNLEEKEKKISSLIPALKGLTPTVRSRISVETYEGKEGMRTVLFDSIRETQRTKKEILGIGINNLRIREQDPIYHKRYTKQREKINAKSRYIIIKGTKIYKHKDAKIKVLPKEFESPTATYIYGNKVSVWLWYDVPVVIVIDSKEVTDSYRSYFEALWKLSKKH
jgi:sugar-specific transcriptional regulator TrmB